MKLLSQINIDPEQLDIPMSGEVDSTTVENLLQIVFGVAGGVAMLIIIYAGIQYILSRGEPEKTKKARDTIIYAAVGLTLAMLAFSIVTWVTGLF